MDAQLGKSQDEANLVAFDPGSEEFQSNRYAIFRKYQKENPIFGQPQSAMSGRQFHSWTVTRYDDVLFMLKDSRFAKDYRTVLPKDYQAVVPDEWRDIVESQRNWMLMKDAPDHTRLRSLVTMAFTPKMVQSLRPRISSVANSLLQDSEPGTVMDIVAGYAFPLPVIVIAELLGVPVEDRDQFKVWSNDIIKTLDFAGPEVLVRGNQVVRELRDYFRDIVRERTVRPKEDLISGLIMARDDKGQLSELELLDMCILILAAGHETTVNLIANGLYLLHEYPEQQQRLRDRRELATSAVEEVLRFESPIQVTSRIVATDFSWHGFDIKVGDNVEGWLAAANRDEAQFPNPDVFDIARQPNRHLSFGMGAHFCLGAPLARAEGEVAFQAFLDAFPKFELAKSAVEWKHSALMRALVALPVRA